MARNHNQRIQVYLTPKEILEYRGYINQLNKAKTTVEVKIYYRLAKGIIDKAQSRR